MKLNNASAFGKFAAKRVSAAAALLFLAGCAALPTSGPTGTQIRSQIADDASKLG